MEELVNNPQFIDMVSGAIFLAFACRGLTRGLYQMIMPFLVVSLAGVGAAALSASLTAPVTEMVYPMAADAVLGAYENGGLDFTKLSWEAAERLSDLAPPGLLEKLDEAERSGALGEIATEIFSEASDKGLGGAVNDALEKFGGAEGGQALRDVAERAAQLAPGADAVADAVREGAVGDAIDGALDAAASGAVGDALNHALSVFRAEFVRSVQLRTTAYVRLILMFLLWTGLIVALTVIKNTLQLATKLPVIKQADRLGGAALGLAECAALFWAAAWLARHTGFVWLAERAQGTRFLSLFV